MRALSGSIEVEELRGKAM